MASLTPTRIPGASTYFKNLKRRSHAPYNNIHYIYEILNFYNLIVFFLNLFQGNTNPFDYEIWWNIREDFIEWPIEKIILHIVR